MQTHYNPGLVSLSLLVAVAASYVALDLVGSVSQARGRSRAGWLTGGALAMGFGIWSMHFIGMLAFEMPGMRMSYDLPPMILSIVVAIVASGFALARMSRPRVAPPALLVSAVAMAGAIAGMHYLGMYSMRMAARIEWDYLLVALSLLIALIASLGAFVVARRLPRARHPGRLKGCASILMGLAIAGMHYTGMEAATFRTDEMAHEASVAIAPAGIPSSHLALIVTTTTLLILALALAGAVTERAFARRARSERESQRRTRDAETASALKTQFLANMSHEIRTPLGAILGFAELLLNADTGAEQRRQYVETILRSARNLSQLLDDILDLSKIEMDHLEVEPRPLDLPDFLADTLSLLNIKADEKGLRLRSVVPEYLPARIVTDAVRLRQILINILGNAIKFTARGEVVLAIARETHAGREVIVFDVRDTGIGIAPAQVAKLFRPFSQADNSMTRRFGGTGLGLDISRRLARALGGDVTLAHSAPGRGSTFRITVACAVAEDQGPAAAPSTTLESTSLIDRAVLLVEDNADNQTLITHVLSLHGARISVAGDGAAGVRAAAAAAYDVILMDIQMPVMNGLDAMTAIRSAGSRVPIIALTAHALPQEREACLAHGANAYLKKPINFPDLIATIDRLTKTS